MDETEAAKACKRRVDHLKDFEKLSLTAQHQWKKQRLDRMLVDYFLRSGYYNTALDLAKSSGIEVRISQGITVTWASEIHIFRPQKPAWRVGLTSAWAMARRRPI